MDFVYVLLYGSEWENITILLSNEDAINDSKNHPNSRVEIFSKDTKVKSGYKPTYNYYKNGELILLGNQGLSMESLQYTFVKLPQSL